MSRRPQEVLIEDAVFLADTGCTLEVAAARLDVKPGTIRTAFRRARRPLPARWTQERSVAS